MAVECFTLNLDVKHIFKCIQYVREIKLVDLVDRGLANEQKGVRA